MIMSLGYVISTHVNYAVPLQRLLDSMVYARIPEERHVYIVTGGCTQSAVISSHPNVYHIDALHNSYDYTGMIELVRQPIELPDYLFFLHDTMEVGSNTDMLVRLADPSKLCTAVWGGQCNLMLCMTSYLRARAMDIVKLVNCSKQSAVQHEGFLWKSAPIPYRDSYAGTYESRDAETPYDGVPRIREYYSGVDIVKWKANWGQNIHSMAVMP